MVLKAITLICTLSAILLCFPMEAAWPQQSNSGVELFKSGQEFLDKARTNEDFQRASEKFIQALNFFEQYQLPMEQSIVLDRLAFINDRLGNYDKSLEFYNRSIALKRLQGNKKGLAITLNNYGALHLKMAKFPRASDAFGEAMEILKSLGDEKAVTQVQSNMGSSFLGMGNYDEALRSFDWIVRKAETTRDTQTLVKALLKRGEIRITLGDYPAAEKDFQEVLKRVDRGRDSEIYIDALSRLGRVMAEQGRLKDADSKLTEALQLNERLPGSIERKADILAIQGQILRDRAVFSDALQKFAEAITIFRRFGNVLGQADASVNIGEIYRRQGMYPEAVRYQNEALAIAENHQFNRVKSRALHNLGSVHMDSGDFARCRENLLQALKINQEIQDTIAQAKNLSSLANMYHSTGSYDLAEQNYLKAIKLLENKDDHRYRSRLRNNLGIIYNDQREYDKAEIEFEESLRIANKAKSEIPKDRIWDNLANLYMNKRFEDPGWKKKAQEQVHKLEQSGLYGVKGGDNSSVGRFYYLTGDFQKAKTYYEELLEVTKRSGDIDDTVAACTGLGLVCEALGNYPDAERFFLIATEKTEQIRQSLGPAERPEFFCVSSRGFARLTPYKGLSRVQIKMGKPEKSFETSEYAKARRFSEDTIARTPISNLGLPRNIQEKDTFLNEASSKAYRALLNAQRSGSSQEVIRQASVKVEQANQQLKQHRISLLGASDPNVRIFGLTNYPDPLPLDKMAIENNEWLISYDVSDSGFIVYLLNGKKLVKAFFEPIDNTKLSMMVEKTLDPLLSVEGRKADFENLRSFNSINLTQLLLGKIIGDLPENEHLIIVPDDCLQKLPFELLMLNSDIRVNHEKGFPYLEGASFLDGRNPISYFQSATALTLSRTVRANQTKGDRVLVMADPVFDRIEVQNKKPNATMATIEGTKDSCLPAKRLEKTGLLARNIQMLYQGKTDVHERLEASKAHLIKKIGPRIEQYNAIVFATHGYFSPKHPDIKQPILLLTMLPKCEDGYLYLSEILGLNVSADIVALTACQSGTGKILPGEGSMSMGRAFQYAGAKSVLMSLWNVHVEASIDLVGNFFSHLKHGRTKLQALRQSRQDLRDAGYKHPYFWSAFILVGEAQ